MIMLRFKCVIELVSISVHLEKLSVKFWELSWKFCIFPWYFCWISSLHAIFRLNSLLKIDVYFDDKYLLSTKFDPSDGWQNIENIILKMIILLSSNFIVSQLILLNFLLLK